MKIKTLTLVFLQKEQIDIELLSNESILQRQERLLSELLKLQTQLSSFRFELNKQKEKIFTSQNDVIDLFRVLIIILILL